MEKYRQAWNHVSTAFILQTLFHFSVQSINIGFVYYIKLQGVPVVAQWKQILLGTMRTWVQFLTSLSGLRIRRCCELCCRLQTRLRSQFAVAVVQAGSYSSDSTPSLGTSICHRCSSKRKKISPFESEQFTMLYCLCLYLIPEHFPHLKRKLHRTQQQSLPTPALPPPPPSPWQPLISFLSLDLPLLDVSYKQNRETCGLCGWLLSLSMMFSRLSHVVACIPSLFWLNDIPCVDVLCFVYPLVHQWTFGLSLPFGDGVNDAAKNFCVQVVVHEYTCSIPVDKSNCFPFLGQ